MHHEKHSTLNDTISVIIMTVIVLLVTTLYLAIAHTVSLGSSIKFIVAIVFLVYIPGYTLLKLTRFNSDITSNLFLSLLVGASIAPTIYSATRIIGTPWLFLLMPMLCLVYFIKENKNLTIQIFRVEQHHLEKVWWLGLITLFIILTLLRLSHFNDLLIFTDQGYLLRDHPTTETMFHIGIINALKSDITPGFPYFSGYNLSYHLNMHIFAELLCRYTGINTLLISYYFLPIFYFLLIISIPAVFFYQLVKNVYFSILFGFTILAGDLSFLLNAFDFSNSAPYVTAGIAFKAPTWGIFTLNGIMPAIPMFFGAAIMFDAYFKENNKRYLLLLILFMTSSFQVKSSMGPHIIGAAFLTLLALYFIKNKINRGILIAIFVSSIITFYDYMARPTPTKNVQIIEFNFLSGVSSALKKLNINTDFLSDKPVMLILFFIAAFLIYSIGSFGLKIYFIKDLRDFFTKKNTQPTTIFLLVFIVSGFILSEIIFIGSKESDINNANWFALQSLYASGFFLIRKLSSIKDTAKRRLVTLIVIIFSFSGTLFYLDIRNNRQYIKITNQQLALSDYVKANVPADSVTIEPLQASPSIISHLSGRTSFATIYVSFLKHQTFISDINERVQIMKDFYNKKYEGNRRAILSKYNIDYILVDKPHKDFVKQLDLGNTVFENNDYALINAQS